MDSHSLHMEDLAKLLKDLYFYYMINNQDADFKDFKNTHNEVCSILIDRINDKYCDHLEGMRKKWTQNIS